MKAIFFAAEERGGTRIEIPIAEGLKEFMPSASEIRPNASENEMDDQRPDRPPRSICALHYWSTVYMFGGISSVIDTVWQSA